MRTIVNSLVGLTVAVTSGCGIGKDNLPPTALIGQPTSGPVLQTRTVGYVSAKEGLVMAQQAASQWDTAAELARIEGTTIEHSYMLGDWNYTFYSPFQRDLALLVIYDGFITKTFTVRREPFSRPIFGGIFRIDSREAIAIAVKNGLRSERIYRIILDQDNPQMRLQWTIQAPEGQFLIDAMTGRSLAWQKT